MRINHYWPSLLFTLVVITSFNTRAQSAEQATIEPTDQAQQLNNISKLIERKVAQSNELENLLAGSPAGKSTDERRKLDNLKRELARLKETFKYVALRGTDIDVVSDPVLVETTWQQDLVEVIKPLIDSLKSLTEKPRKISQLRENIQIANERLSLLNTALSQSKSLVTENLDPPSLAQLKLLQENWDDDIQQLTQDKLISTAKLADLTGSGKSLVSGLLPATKQFMFGRGLTLLIAIVAAGLTWALMRLLWWFYNRQFTSKDIRRNSTWYRVIAYSYYFLTILVIAFCILIVLYSREDLLLLAIAFLLIAGATLSFRNFLPKYIGEARLLLNLGGVREDERLVYNGLPWLVMSLNLHSVLRNPALDGVIRLPLDQMRALVSRPVKKSLWFPTSKGDIVMLPDGVLGSVKNQTPDLVEVSVKGGMVITYPTSEFYSLSILNLSRDKTFGVSIDFGLDYGIQAISLSEVPEFIKTSVTSTLHNAGYKEALDSMVVELSVANTSSLDFLVWVGLKNDVAADYYRIQ